MRPYTLYQVDVFTTEPFAGNAAGVVTDARGLTGKQMQSIAAELKNSETAFIFPPEGEGEGDDHDVYVRFFTPETEVPICGHATLGAQYARALQLDLGTVRVLQKSGAGVTPVDVLRNESGYRVVMTQQRIEFYPELDPSLIDPVLRALGLKKSDVDDRCPIQVVSTGHSKLIVGVNSAVTLNKLEPDLAALRRLADDVGCRGYFVFTFDCEIDGSLTECRMFAPQVGIPEDPVTGNGNGPLGAYLVRHELVKHDDVCFKFSSTQGRAMGRRGTAYVEVFIRGGEPVEVRVGGDVVTVFTAEMLV